MTPRIAVMVAGVRELSIARYLAEPARPTRPG